MLTLATSPKNDLVTGLWAPVHAFFKALVPPAALGRHAGKRASACAFNAASHLASSASPRFLTTLREPLSLARAPSISVSRPVTTSLIANNQATTRASHMVRMVRIVRMVEPGQKSTSSGRMVISGSMADVCAELDRLVAREATLH